jgi:hypothetical protein
MMVIPETAPAESINNILRTIPSVTNIPPATVSPLPTQLPVIVNTTIAPSWAETLIITVAGVLIAGLLGKIITDYWHNNVAKPKVTVGFHVPTDSETGTIMTSRTLTVEEMRATVFDFPIWVFLNTKIPFSKNAWEIRINFYTDGKVRVTNVLQLHGNVYQVFKGLIPKATAYKLGGINLNIDKPFTKPIKLETRITIGSMIHSKILTIHPALEP